MIAEMVSKQKTALVAFVTKSAPLKLWKKTVHRTTKQVRHANGGVRAVKR